MHTVPDVLPRSLCGWPRTSLHLLEEGHNHPIVRLAYLCHMVVPDVVFLSFWYIKLFELGVEVSFTINPRSPTTKLICSHHHFGAAALSAPMMLWCCSFASASFTSRNPSSLSIDRLNSRINLQILIDCDPTWSPAPETIYGERHWIEVVPCLLPFFDWYCHLYCLCLLRQIFLGTDS